MFATEQIRPMLIDVAEKLYTYQDNGDNLLFEGAQGALLDSCQPSIYSITGTQAS
jgi:adenylosuccinate synthase